jgi:hypothetical protein
MDSFSTEKLSKYNTKESSNIKNDEVFEYYYKKIVIKDYECLGKGSSITHIEWFSRTTKRNREYNYDNGEEDTMNTSSNTNTSTCETGVLNDKEKYKKQKY